MANTQYQGHAFYKNAQPGDKYILAGRVKATSSATAANQVTKGKPAYIVGMVAFPMPDSSVNTYGCGCIIWSEPTAGEYVDVAIPQGAGIMIELELNTAVATVGLLGFSYGDKVQQTHHATSRPLCWMQASGAAGDYIECLVFNSQKNAGTASDYTYQ